MNKILEKEEVFHDQWALSVNVNEIEVDNLFETASCAENKQIMQWMGNVENKKILELGCGLGEASVYFAKKGALVTATDLSSEMLNVANKLAERHSVKIQTQKASATDLSNLEAGSYDMVYAANLLHHVPIEDTLRAVHAVLKPGGQAFFWDPIKYNPAINVYRKLATEVRTEDEHPLGLSDFKLFNKIYQNVEFKFFWFTSLYVFFHYFFIRRLNPNKVRYWKQIIVDGKKLNGTLNVLHRIDGFLFKYIPGLKYLAWNVAVKCQK